MEDEKKRSPEDILLGKQDPPVRDVAPDPVEKEGAEKEGDPEKSGEGKKPYDVEFDEPLAGKYNSYSQVTRALAEKDQVHSDLSQRLNAAEEKLTALSGLFGELDGVAAENVPKKFREIADKIGVKVAETDTLPAFKPDGEWEDEKDFIPAIDKGMNVKLAAFGKIQMAQIRKMLEDYVGPIRQKHEEEQVKNFVPVADDVVIKDAAGRWGEKLKRGEVTKTQIAYALAAVEKLPDVIRLLSEKEVNREQDKEGATGLPAAHRDVKAKRQTAEQKALAVLGGQPVS